MSVIYRSLSFCFDISSSSTTLIFDTKFNSKAFSYFSRSQVQSSGVSENKSEFYLILTCMFVTLCLMASIGTLMSYLAFFSSFSLQLNYYLADSYWMLTLFTNTVSTGSSGVAPIFFGLASFYSSLSTIFALQHLGQQSKSQSMSAYLQAQQPPFLTSELLSQKSQLYSLSPSNGGRCLG